MTTFYDIRKDHQAAQRDAFVKTISWNLMLLASVSTYEHLGTLTDQLGVPRIADILDALVDEVQIGVYMFLESLRAEEGDSLYTGVGRGCG